MKKNRVYAGIDLDALRYNMESMHKNIKEGTKIAAVIKADAYGHGALTVAKTIENLPYVWGFAVATADEAEMLIADGRKKPILILGISFPEHYELIVEKEIRPAICEYESAKALSDIAVRKNKTCHIHIKIDTGLHRIGFAPEEQKSADAQFAAVKAAVIAELRRTFRPEFLNRVDETIVFRRLSREDCAEIARRLLAQTVSRAAALGITLEADEDCAVSLAERGYDVSYGARPLRRLIRSEVEDALATCLLDGTLASGDTAVLAAENGTLCVRRREKAAAAALGDVGAQKA